MGLLGPLYVTTTRRIAFSLLFLFYFCCSCHVEAKGQAAATGPCVGQFLEAISSMVPFPWRSLLDLIFLYFRKGAMQCKLV